MFKKETNLNCFIGLKVALSTGEVGVLDGTFGQSGVGALSDRNKFGSFNEMF